MKNNYIMLPCQELFKQNVRVAIPNNNLIIRSVYDCKSANVHLDINTPEMLEGTLRNEDLNNYIIKACYNECEIYREYMNNAHEESEGTNEKLRMD